MTASKKELSGIVPIVPTPFLDNEEIDEAALRSLIDFAVSTGVSSRMPASVCK